MKKHFLKIFCIIMALFLLASCGSHKDEVIVEPTLSETSIELAIGESTQLRVNDYTADTIWTSTDENVASVDQRGNVNALSLGNAAITAQIDGDKTLSCIVAVTPGISNVTNIRVTGYYSSSSDITVDYTSSATAMLRAVCTQGADNEVLLWSSSDEGVATVDSNGNVTAHANGTAVISAAAVNGVKGDCIIRVKGAPANSAESTQMNGSETQTEGDYAENETDAAPISVPTTSPDAQSSIIISETELYMDVAEDIQLNVTLDNAPDGTIVEWMSSNRTVAVVRYGKVIAVGNGVAIISAVTTDGAAVSCYVAVGKAAKKEIKKILEG